MYTHHIPSSSFPPKGNPVSARNLTEITTDLLEAQKES